MPGSPATISITLQRFTVGDSGLLSRAFSRSVVPTESLKKRTARGISHTFFLVIGAMAVLPLQPVMPSSGVDPSWKFAMDQAVSAGREFGLEVIFPYGPLGSVITRTFHPDLVGQQYLAGLAFSAVIGFCLSKLWSLRSRLVAILLSGAFVAVGYFSVEYLFAAAAIVLFYLTASQSISGRWMLVLVWLPFSLFPLMKGTLFVLWLLIVPLLVVQQLVQRQPHRHSAMLFLSQIAAVPLAWISAGYGVSGLFLGLGSTLWTITGYSMAMSIPGPGWQVVLAIVGGVAALGATAALLTARGLFLRYLPFQLAVAVFLFLAFKSGFVRHDNHVFMYLFSLGVVALLAVTFAEISDRTLLGYGLLFGIPALVAGTLTLPLERISNVPGEIGFRIASLGQLLSGPPAYFARQEAVFESRVTSLQRSVELETWCAGAIDFVPHEASLVASLPTWDPRPTFQSYSVYNQRLERRNYEHLRDLPLGARMIVAVDTIDGRMPLGDEPAIWQEIRTNFEEIASSEHGLCVEKTSTATALEKNPLAMEGVLGRRLVFAEEGRATVEAVDIQIHQTWMGHLKGLLYKPEPLYVSFELEDGSVRKYRFIPSDSGVPVPLLIESDRDLSRWLSSEAVDKRVTALQIDTVRTFSQDWSSEYSVRVVGH